MMSLFGAQRAMTFLSNFNLQPSLAVAGAVVVIIVVGKLVRGYKNRVATVRESDLRCFITPDAIVLRQKYWFSSSVLLLEWRQFFFSFFLLRLKSAIRGR